MLYQQDCINKLTLLRYEQALGIKVYFAKPYHSWERGTNENRNGVVRKILPKGSPFDAILDEEMRRIDRMLNDRPLGARPARRSQRSCTATSLPRPDAASLFEMAGSGGRAWPSAHIRRDLRLKPAFQAELKTAILPTNHKKVLA